MSYRFVRVTENYPNFIKQHHQKHQEARFLSYDEQYKLITRESLESSVSFGRNLRAIGVDATEIITNDSFMQATWAKEHGLDETKNSSEIIFEQLKFYRPDIIWIDTTFLLDKNWIAKIKNEIPEIKLITGHICAPYNTVIESSLPHFDIMFTCTPCFVKDIKAQGGSPYLLYHSFDEKVLDLIRDEKNTFESTDFLFTGSLLTGYGLHKTRIEYLEEFLKQNINLKIYGNIESQKTIRLKQTMHHTIKLMQTFGMESIIRRVNFLNKYKKYADCEIKNYSKQLTNAIRKPVFGLDMYKVLDKAKICFNIHGEIAKICGGNIRLFEATGIGTCLVTDHKENMNELFKINSEIITYSGMNDCVEKVKWLLNNPSKAEEIANAGQKRTLNDHSIKKRAQELNYLFLNRLNNLN